MRPLALGDLRAKRAAARIDHQQRALARVGAEQQAAAVVQAQAEGGVLAESDAGSRLQRPRVQPDDPCVGRATGARAGDVDQSGGGADHELVEARRHGGRLLDEGRRGCRAGREHRGRGGRPEQRQEPAPRECRGGNGGFGHVSSHGCIIREEVIANDSQYHFLPTLAIRLRSAPRGACHCPRPQRDNLLRWQGYRCLS
jgi:hypothetical protein